MEDSPSNLVSIAGACGTILLLCVLHFRFLLSKVDTRVVVLLHFLEEVESGDDDFLAVKGDSEGIGAKGDLLDLTLMVTNEAAHQVFGKGSLRHHMHLTWVINGRDKNPLGVVLKIIVSFVPNNVSELLKVASDLVK